MIVAADVRRLTLQNFRLKRGMMSEPPNVGCYVQKRTPAKMRIAVKGRMGRPKAARIGPQNEIRVFLTFSSRAMAKSNRNLRGTPCRWSEKSVRN